MSNSNYKPKSNIGEYLISSFNLSIFRALINTKPFSQSYFYDYKLLNELDFFNTLYEQHELLNKGQLLPIHVIEQIDKLKLNPIQNGVLLYFLVELLKTEIDHKLSEPISHTVTYFKPKLYREIIERKLKYKVSSIFTKRFNIDVIENHINTFNSTNEKVNYILEIQKDFNLIMSYKEFKIYYDSEISIDFNNQCKVLLDHLSNIKNESISRVDNIVLPVSKLIINNKKGAKINLIRILNSIYHLQLITLPNGDLPTKEYFMEEIGKFLGQDFSRYDIDLSQALNEASIETNSIIFDKLKKILVDEFLKRNKKS